MAGSEEICRGQIIKRIDSLRDNPNRAAVPLDYSEKNRAFTLLVNTNTGVEPVSTDEAGYYYTRVGQQIRYQQTKGRFTGLIWVRTYAAAPQSL